MVPGSVCDFFAVSCSSLPQSYNSFKPSRPQVTRSCYGTSCGMIDRPPQVNQERLVLWRRGKGVMKLCGGIATECTGNYRDTPAHEVSRVGVVEKTAVIVISSKSSSR